MKRRGIFCVISLRLQAIYEFTGQRFRRENIGNPQGVEWVEMYSERVK